MPGVVLLTEAQREAARVGRYQEGDDYVGVGKSGHFVEWSLGAEVVNDLSSCGRLRDIGFGVAGIPVMMLMTVEHRSLRQ
jgi:hypothetical protein